MSHRPHVPASPRSHAYWRSVEELAETPAFRRWLAAEFPFVPPEWMSGPSRRQFLKLMGAACALAGLTGCRWPKETIVPATKQPVNRVPGETVQYATAFELGGAATGVLVTSYDGRPIKIEGNPKHPFSRGKTNHWMQASILDLYDPDRSQRPVERDPQGRVTNRTWAEFEASARGHFAGLREGGSARLAVLSEASSSPSRQDMKARFAAAFPEAQWYEYEPISRDNEIEGARLAFGRPFRSHLHLDRADLIVGLDADFLMMHPVAVKHAADFAARRRAADGTMNRLYVIEGGLSVTGSVADTRFAVRPSQIGHVLEALAVALSARLGTSLLAGEPAGDCPVDAAQIEVLAEDLRRHEGRCLIVVGPAQPPEVHCRAHALNAALGAHGQTVSFTDEPDPQRPTHLEALRALTERAKAGEIQTLVILGGNPVYDAPADLGFAVALPRVPASVHLSMYDNETSRACTWHVPQAHYLESWGDALAWDGTLSIVQPLIEPLYGGRTACELLALLIGDDRASGYDITRRTFGILFDHGVDRQRLWEQSLHDGVAADTAWPAATPAVGAARSIPAAPPAGDWELVFAADYSVYDGRYANNAWLQEWPDPITKLTWDNAALVSPADAERLGVTASGQNIDIVGVAGDPNRHLILPAMIVPGHAGGCITLPLGYARGYRARTAGVVGRGVGFDTYGLRTSGQAAWAVPREVGRKLGAHELATTQDHHAIRSRVGDEELQARIPVLVREATLAEYRDPQFAEHFRHRVHHPPLESLWKEKEYPGHRWGMAIDLSACTGCGACVVACQAENNIPVVGKAEVLMGREMHWIRVDRYFRDEGGEHDRTQAQGHEGPEAQREERESRPAGAPGPDVRVVHQPVACVHCELAPCEQVCPVAATVHDEEGLNVMVYNRCIGTRYCSNNCPFKVRRFNWFRNHHGPYHPRALKGSDAGEDEGRAAAVLPRPAKLTDIEKLVNNPEVTVRSRGVMEKCTFCVQRIIAVKIKARNERWAKIPDGLIVPACAQACPTDAIVFGDLNDPDSRVRKLHADPRAYALLAELNIKPRTAYLARLRNPKGHTE